MWRKGTNVGFCVCVRKWTTSVVIAAVLLKALKEKLFGNATAQGNRKVS